MRSFIRTCIVSLLLSLSCFGTVHLASAVDEGFLTPSQPILFTPTGDGKLAPVASTNPQQDQNINLLFQGPQALLRFLFGLFTLIGILASMYAGSIIVFSQGDPKKVQRGFFMLLYTAIGFIIIGSAWFVIRFLLNFSF